MRKVGLCLCILAFASSSLFLACAKPTDELIKAEQALERAKDAGAPELAPERYKSAEDKLTEGRKLIDDCKYKKAKKALQESAELSELAIQEAKAAKKPKPAKEQAKEKPLPAEGIAETYEVVKGDCLWNIAKKPSIYGDPYLWPLIYDANKDQIKNPNLIYPKQVLKIRRDITEDEIKAARRRAGAPKE